MNSLPEPAWPVLVLAFVQAVDGVMCIKPVAFIAECFQDVGFPRRHWWMMPVIKFAASLGLVAGLWLPHLGAVTCGALVVYFAIAIAMHVRAKDYGRNLFVNASGMLVLCVATFVISFAPWPEVGDPVTNWALQLVVRGQDASSSESA